MTQSVRENDWMADISCSINFHIHRKNSTDFSSVPPRSSLCDSFLQNQGVEQSYLLFVDSIYMLKNARFFTSALYACKIDRRAGTGASQPWLLSPFRFIHADGRHAFYFKFSQKLLGKIDIASAGEVDFDHNNSGPPSRCGLMPARLSKKQPNDFCRAPERSRALLFFASGTTRSVPWES